jgi:hypothetical protein
VRRLWHLLEEASWQAVEVSEQFADDPGLILDLMEAQEEAAEVAQLARRRVNQTRFRYYDHLIDEAADNDGAELSAEGGYRAYAAYVAAGDAGLAAEAAALVALDPLNPRRLQGLLWGPYGIARIAYRGGAGAERAAQARLLREVAGNPFRRVRVYADWLRWNDRTIPRLAESIYEERAFERLPILADALEDAGCTDPDILGHCRRPAAHVPGCWFLDLVLRKG